MRKSQGILRAPFYNIEKFDKPMKDYWGKRIARPISIHKLKTAFEHIQYGGGKEVSFLRDLEKALVSGGRPFKKVRIELFQEGLYQWVFLVSGSFGRSTAGPVVMLLAKDGKRFSSVARQEFTLLNVLHERNNKQVAKTLGSTTVTVETEQGPQELFGYFTQLIPDFTELGIDAEHRFYMVGIQQVERLSLRASDLMRSRILELLASLYEPETGSALVDVEVNSGDFLGRILEGTVDVRLIAVRRLRSGMAPAGLLRALMRPMGEHAEAKVFLYPEAARNIIDALMTGLRRAYKGDRDAAALALRKGLKKNADGDSPFPREGLSWTMLLDHMDRMYPPPR